MKLASVTYVSVVLLNLVHCQFRLIFPLQQHFEFENVVTEDQLEHWQWRSEAYSNKTLRLNDVNQTFTVELYLCFDPIDPSENVTMYISDIRYSNDGPSDIVYVTLDGKSVGNITTDARWRAGHEWNIFKNTGMIGQPQTLYAGEHVLRLSTRTDSYGIELDRIRVNLVNHRISTFLFCGSKLVKNDRSSDSTPSSIIPR